MHAEDVMKETYKIGEKTITMTGAANFISQQLFPKPEHRLRSRQIGNKIRRAQKKELLPFIEHIPADIFFGWAIEQKGWQRLREIPGIPISSSVLMEGVNRELVVRDLLPIGYFLKS